MFNDCADKFGFKYEFSECSTKMKHVLYVSSFINFHTIDFKVQFIN